MPTPEDKAHEHIDQAPEQFCFYASGGQPNTNLAALYSHTVLRAPFEEQPKIVAKVDRRPYVIEELEASVEANLTRVAAAVHSAESF